MYKGQFPSAGVFGVVRKYMLTVSDSVKDVKKERNAMEKSPCLTCTRVKNPGDCENKNCRVWREWFLTSWDSVRNYPRLKMESSHAGPESISIGGNQYVLPHRMREYLEKDPCENCLCPKDLCTSPCPSRRAWLEAKKEASV